MGLQEGFRAVRANIHVLGLAPGEYAELPADQADPLIRGRQLSEVEAVADDEEGEGAAEDKSGPPLVQPQPVNKPEATTATRTPSDAKPANAGPQQGQPPRPAGQA